MVKIAAHGLEIEVHHGWEGRMWRPHADPPVIAGPVVRLANFALPTTRDTYAAEVADVLRPSDVLVSLVEFDRASANTGLYAGRGAPTLDVGDLDPNAVQVAGPGRLGVQRFFSLRNRAFSLYVMAHEGRDLRHAFDVVNASLRSFRVGAR